MGMLGQRNGDERAGSVGYGGSGGVTASKVVVLYICIVHLHSTVFGFGFKPRIEQWARKSTGWGGERSGGAGPGTCEAAGWRRAYG